MMLPKCDNTSLQSISREELINYAWLAAAIDGEGSIGLNQNKARRGYTAYVTITNTDPYFIQKISQIFSVLNVKYFYGFSRRINENRRDRLTITASGLGGVHKVLTHILPYMTCKRHQAKCLIDFIEWRWSIGFHKGPEKNLELHEKADSVRSILQHMRHIEFNLQRLQRTASIPLEIDDDIVRSSTAM